MLSIKNCAGDTRKDKSPVYIDPVLNKSLAKNLKLNLFELYSQKYAVSV